MDIFFQLFFAKSRKSHTFVAKTKPKRYDKNNNNINNIFIYQLKIKHL